METKELSVASRREVDAGAKVSALVPTTLEGAYNLATRLANSGIVPAAMRGKPDDTLAAMLLGMEVGISPVQSVMGIAVINGRPSIFGDLAVAIVRNSPLCDYLRPPQYTGEGDSLTCTATGKRAGEKEEVSFSFSWADAKRAKLTGKDNWVAYPKDMLWYKAFHRLKSFLWPDVMKGIAVKEVADDYTDVQDVDAEVVIEPPTATTVNAPQDAEPEQVAPAKPPAKRGRKAAPVNVQEAEVEQPAEEQPVAEEQAAPAEPTPVEKEEEAKPSGEMVEVGARSDNASAPCHVSKVMLRAAKDGNGFVYFAVLANGDRKEIIDEDTAKLVKHNLRDKICVLMLNDDGKIIGGRYKNQ